MRKSYRWALIALLVVTSVVGDQITKALAREHLIPGEPIPLVGGIVVLEYSENVGSFLSLGARLPPTARFWLMTVLAGAMVVAMLAFLIAAQALPLLETVALALMTGGGIGNLIDRILNQGRVVDFVHIGMGSLRTGIFNIADVALTGGAIVLLLRGLADYARMKRIPDPELDDDSGSQEACQDSPRM